MKYSIRILFAGTLSICMAGAPMFAVLAVFDSNDARFAAREVLKEQHTIRTSTASFRTDEVLVKFKDAKKFSRVAIPEGVAVEEFVTQFKNRSDILYAEPNYIATAYAIPNDPYYSYQWHLDNTVNGGIHTEAAWDVTQGEGVIVAIVDTGIAYETYNTYVQAPDLASTTFIAGYDFVNNDTHPNDDNNHGTHVAGTIAQSTNNNVGVVGVAYKAAIMPVKVLDRNGSGSYADVADGIRWAADNGARVINLSLGGPSPSFALQDAVAYAYNKGVTIVAASGNENGAIGYPAAYDDYVIAVGATRFDEARAPYSNYGSSLDIVAPGGDLQVDQNSDGYADGVLQQTFSGSVSNFGYYFFQGTSMATPHVAGVAALVIANGNATTPDQVRAALESSADDLGTAGWDQYYGHGLVNAAAALGYTTGPVVPPTVLTVFSDSFEVSEWNGLWSEDSQNDWFRSSQRATQGSRSAEVDGLAKNASLTSIPVNLMGRTNATIIFDWYIESSLDVGEYVKFLVSTDGGLTWVEKAIISGNVGTENTWQTVSIPVSGISNLHLRFQGKMSQSDEDANVDNVKVTAW